MKVFKKYLDAYLKIKLDLTKLIVLKYLDTMVATICDCNRFTVSITIKIYKIDIYQCKVLRTIKTIFFTVYKTNKRTMFVKNLLKFEI